MRVHNLVRIFDQLEAVRLKERGKSDLGLELAFCRMVIDAHNGRIFATNNLSVKEEQEEDGFLLSYVEELPAELLGEILKHHPNFAIRHSMTAGDSYFMTVCECGGHFGDHYVQKRLLNLAFRTPDEISVQELPLDGTWVIPCAYSQSISVSKLLDRARIWTANR